MIIDKTIERNLEREEREEKFIKEEISYRIQIFESVLNLIDYINNNLSYIKRIKTAETFLKRINEISSIKIILFSKRRNSKTHVFSFYSSLFNFSVKRDLSEKSTKIHFDDFILYDLIEDLNIVLSDLNLNLEESNRNLRITQENIETFKKKLEVSKAS